MSAGGIGPVCMNLNVGAVYESTTPERAQARIESALFGRCRVDTSDENTGRRNSSGPEVDRSLSSCIPLLAQKECSQARCTLTEEAGLIYDLYCRSRESISMEIIASAIFGRSSFTFRLSRMISFTYQYAHCPSNRIYKRALGSVCKSSI